MAVQGEKFLLLMGYMHFLCLLVARHSLQMPLNPGRAILACTFSSLYSLLSLLPGLPFSQPLCMLCCTVSSGILAFGKRGVHAFLPQWTAGLVFAGACAFLKNRGLGPGFCLAVCTMLSLLLCIRQKEAEKAVLEITFHGKKCRICVLRDTGNNLLHPVLGLPVIVCSAKSIRCLLPENFDPAPEKLLPGFMLVAAQTVKGKMLLPCFLPDSIRDTKTGTPIAACIGVCEQSLPWGLMPGCIQIKEERGRWKRTVFSEKMNPPSVNG